jgi:short-subunit dehydrogenase
MRDLNGRVAVITGAAGGIGCAIAAELARRGCHLALADVDPTRLEALAASLAASAPGRRITTHVIDVGTPEGNTALAEAVVLAHGAPWLVILNAGVTTHGPFASQTVDDVQWVVRTDLLGVMYGSHAFIPHLTAEGGHLVLLSSMAAMTGTPLQSTYSAAKAGVRAFAAALRVELRGAGIGVTAILPGTIATGFLTRARGRHSTLGLLARAMPAVGLSPDRVARAITYAVDRDRAEQTVGPDAWIVERITRAWPRLLPALFSLAYPWLKQESPP